MPHLSVEQIGGVVAIILILVALAQVKLAAGRRRR